MDYRIVIPARGKSKRLPGKNMRLLGNKPLIQYSIDTALAKFQSDYIWVNSDDQEIIDYAKRAGVKHLLRPDNLATDLTPTVDVIKHQLEYFDETKVNCDAIILLQPTNPFRESHLLDSAISKFEQTNRKSLATFSYLEKKIGNIENDFFVPKNYLPGQRSQDLKNSYFENGQLYITKRESIKLGEIITEDVYPYISKDIEATVDIDYIEDFHYAEFLLKFKKYEKKSIN